jgi:hypothetical protein
MAQYQRRVAAAQQSAKSIPWILKPFLGGDDVDTLVKESGDLIALMSDPNNAPPPDVVARIAGGSLSLEDYLAQQGLGGSSPVPNVAPTPAPAPTPTPGATASPLQRWFAPEERDRAPQATSIPPELLPGRESERARQEMRNKVGDKKAQWQDSWKRKHPNDPIGGEVERSYYKQFLRESNLIDEQVE